MLSEEVHDSQCDRKKLTMDDDGAKRPTRPYQRWKNKKTAEQIAVVGRLTVVELRLLC